MNETIETNCTECRRKLRYPAVRAQQAAREGKALILFCSQRCNLRYTARVGSQQQAENLKLREEQLANAIRNSQG